MFKSDLKVKKCTFKNLVSSFGSVIYAFDSPTSQKSHITNIESSLFEDIYATVSGGSIYSKDQDIII